jgi:acyl-CoA synthetase (AMP-forming)/AMP-acid ligase II/thioesterase domain-containing protein/acyl carrier protein
MRHPASAILAPIAQYAELNPDATALVEPNGETHSYREFWLRTEACRLRLEEAGVASGQIVAVLAPQGALQIVAVAGVMSHCACAALQPRTTVHEVAAILRRLSACVLVASADFDAELMAAKELGLTILVADAKQSPSQWQIRRSGSAAESQNGRTDAALILATSATTSAPKLVPLTESNLEAGIAARRNSLELAAGDRLLLMTSLSHITGFENALAQFQSGGTVIATSGFDPTAYIGWLGKLQPTWYACAPAVHQAALSELMRDPPEAPLALRLIQSAGAPLPDKVREGLEQILQIPIFNDYGMTEACPIAVDAFLSGGRVPGAAGRACGLEIRILDSSGEFLPPGGIGEIVVRGPSVFSGYMDDPEASHAAFHDGWFKTGDAGRLDDDGNLFVTGRLKEMINRGGEKVAPSEVDAVMASHPAVLEAVTFAVPHPTLGEAVACAVILDPSIEAPPQISELRRFAATHLARFKVPSRIFIVDEIPRGELGKPQRWVLSERLADKRGTPPSAAEMTEHSSDVVFYRAYEIWSRILDRDDLGFDENFFDAGGDSLGAITMLAEVDQRFGCQTSGLAASFLDEPTLVRLVELVGTPPLPRPSGNESNELRVFPLRVEGSPQRFFCVPGDGDEGLYFRRLATHLHGTMDFFTVRPANTWMSQSLFTFEDAGTTTAKLIRDVQGEGPYLVGGFCSGGIVAVEAARQLISEGADVRLVLFDVYRPGCPSPVRGRRTWVASARAQWRERGKAHSTNFALNLGYVLRRLAWSAVTPMRRLLAPVERNAAVQWFLRKAQKGNLPFYKATPIKAPVLHFLCVDEPNLIDCESRFGWKAMARKGITEEFLAFDHMNLFHESNLPKIVESLVRSSSQQQPAREPEIVGSAQSEVSA